MEIRESISSLDVKFRMGLDLPTEETRNLLDNDTIDGVWNSHEEFMESLANDYEEVKMNPKSIKESILLYLKELKPSLDKEGIAELGVC